MIDLSMVTSSIVAMGVGATWEKAKRREAVIKLLKRLKLDPINPPTDFDGIYAYTLIEYGMDRPEPILNFFRNKFVREAFEHAFYKNDPSILDKEADGIIEWNEETGKLGRIDYDPRREFAAFSTVFHTIVDRTRTLAEVKRDQVLDSIRDDIHDSSTEIIKRLDIFVDLEKVRDERNRLIQATPLDILVKQMKEWFETLNYSFENYNVRTNNYFEWIMDVPARRGYDRILVHGIVGEAKVSDVIVLRQSVDEHKTSEGWLVAVRRVGQAARDEVKKQGNGDLYCYTFDELLDEHADFTGYLKWLEEEIKSRGIDRMYVPLSCTKEDFDPSSGKVIGKACYDESNGWLEGYIDRWLDDPSKEHVSILGEFGTGKTWFVLHYAWIALRRYNDAKARGIERPRLPLVIPLRDYAKAVSVESLFSEFFFRKHEIPLSGYSVFDKLNRMGKLLLIFDGFDEMADKVDRQKMINNFWELANVVVPYSKVILTCRTEHFPEAKEGRALLNAELQASTAKLTGNPPQFEVLELQHFNDDQIRKVLLLRTEPSIAKQIMENKQLLDLARRPVMTELILEALPAIEAGKPIDLSRVYLYAVHRKMERDISNQRTFTSLADKLFFLCELSWEMLSTHQMSLNYRHFPKRLHNLFGSVIKEQKDLDHWHYDMLGQTLLIRNADGDYTPAHRSFLEFFVAFKFASELGILASDFTELARVQTNVNTNAEQQDYTWSSYFKRKLDDKRNVKPIRPLRKFVPEPIDRLATTIGKEPIARAILDLMESMIISDKEELKTQLLTLVKSTRGQIKEEVGCVGGNIATILVRSNKSALKGTNLSGTNLSYAILAVADLTKCDLSFCDLSNISFTHAKLKNANLTGSDMFGAIVKSESWICGLGMEIDENIHFLYPFAAFDTRYEPIELENLKKMTGLDEGEILILRFNRTTKECYWSQKIRSLYIIDANFSPKKEEIKMLTIEGEYISIDTKNGEISIDDKKPSLLWKGANLTGVKGLNEKNAYLLKLFGAIDIGPTSFNPREDSFAIGWTVRPKNQTQ